MKKKIVSRVEQVITSKENNIKILCSSELQIRIEGDFKYKDIKKML